MADIEADLVEEPQEEEEPPVLDRRGTEIPGTEAPCPVHADDFLACFAVHCIRRIL